MLWVQKFKFKIFITYVVVSSSVVSNLVYANQINSKESRLHSISIGQTALEHHNDGLADIWSIENLNQVIWQPNSIQEVSGIYAKVQVLLSRNFASTGVIDGNLGLNTVKAISAFQIINGLSGNGQLDRETWGLLNQKKDVPSFIEYRITSKDVEGPYVKNLPLDYAEQVKLKALSYSRVSEMLAEKFHMDEFFLQKINPGANFERVGEVITVSNVTQELPNDIQYLVAHKGMKQLYAFNKNHKMVASFPATIGSDTNPSPSGTHTIKNIIKNPHYSYNPKNFIQANNLKPLSLPPGPNNPVGLVWIGLSKPSFGIHGTPSPSLVSKSASHGCIRLTNWDALRLAQRLSIGTQIKFLD